MDHITEEGAEAGIRQRLSDLLNRQLNRLGYAFVRIDGRRWIFLYNLNKHAILIRR